MQRTLHRRDRLRWRHGRHLCARHPSPGGGRRRAVDTGSDLMAKAFGFDEDEVKMLLVAVRQMRRTFAAARKTAPEPQPAVDAYARLYDDLYAKLLEMAGPLPPAIEEGLGKKGRSRAGLSPRECRCTQTSMIAYPEGDLNPGPGRIVRRARRKRRSYSAIFSPVRQER